MIFQLRTLRSTALVILAACTQSALAQSPINWIVPTGNWTVGGNWDTGIAPDTNFDELANINNGGTATVSSPVNTGPGQVVLGQSAGASGTLTIANGGNLPVTFTPGNVSTGGVNVGQAGTGHLIVQPGGTLTARTITVAGETGSSVVLGGIATGTTTVTTEFGATFGRNLRVIGPNVNFSTQTLMLQPANTYVAQITGASHSPLKSTNLATLGGTLRIEFGPGVTPMLGNRWNLIDAPSFAGAFSNIDTSTAPALPTGQVYRFEAVDDPSSVHGQFGRLSIEQLLVLNVNRSTGAVSINTGTAPVDIDGYAISSPLGGLVPGNWNSLQDQGVSDWRESPPGGAATQLAELKPTASTAIAPGTPRPLGNIFRYPMAQEFGTELEDLAFEYYTTDGRTIQGLLNYEGDKRFNNLVLVVDPTSGAARLENQSSLGVDIDGYKISSATGSLLPANGNWNSLDDQSAAGGDWRESNPTVNQLVELKPGGEALVGGGATFNMGSLFKTAAAGGTQDLTFEYLLPDESEFTGGVVVYRSLGTALAGDYNNNGVVDAADYVVWRNEIGTPAAYETWRANFGRTAASGSMVAGTSVPEPASVLLASTVACPFVMRSRRRKPAHRESRKHEA
jgi:hypothetical protein